MPLPSFRNSRSKVRRRRSHHALKPVSTLACASCGAIPLPHRACRKCGAYNGRSVNKTGTEEVKKVLTKKVAVKKSPAKKVAKKAAKKSE
jgi:large subunit ribosomal protein L32